MRVFVYRKWANLVMMKCSRLDFGILANFGVWEKKIDGHSVVGEP